MGNLLSNQSGGDVTFVLKKQGKTGQRLMLIPKEVFKLIVEHAGIFDLQALCGTNREIRAMSRNEVDRRVMELLESFSLNARTTLLLLRNTKAYISGSAVLSVIDPGMFTPGDLDFYVAMSHAHEIWIYLWQRRNRGWRQLIEDNDFEQAGLPIPDPDDYCGIPGIARVWYFKHTGTAKVINIIVTRTSSALPAIIRFHSTIVMNVIAYFGVVSLYASLTRARVGFTTKEDRLTPRDLKCVEKYRDRGYKIYRDSRLSDFVGNHECGRDGRCSQTYRSLLDDEVAVAAFTGYMPQTKADLLRSMDDVLLWRLRNQKCYRSNRDTTALIVTSEGDNVNL